MTGVQTIIASLVHPERSLGRWFLAELLYTLWWMGCIFVGLWIARLITGG